jgi:hypothetical protein
MIEDVVFNRAGLPESLPYVPFNIKNVVLVRVLSILDIFRVYRNEETLLQDSS